MSIVLMQILLIIFQIMCLGAYIFTKERMYFVIVTNIMIAVFILGAIK
jgi:hypothetical protein